MATFILNISADLEARIKALGGSINWSEVLHPAIQAAVNAFEQQRRHQAETTDGPAHDQPATNPSDDYNLGRQAGAIAAKTTLDEHAAIVLCMVPTAAISEDYTPAMIKAALDPENRIAIATFNHDYFAHENPSRSYLMGFVEGVQQVVTLHGDLDDQIPQPDTADAT